MRIKRARQILKAFSDDTRLRIINLLEKEELAVNEICRTLGKNQSIISKHLTRLRLTGIVRDRRNGIKVYYCMVRLKDRHSNRLVRSIAQGISGMETFRGDLKKLRRLKKKR
ncbi:MAG: metalloregulator ArsR/SmtB family transcription factor [Candidatus Omnitrophica bacterium]|nr:metalloregulator ArsR/SmtB family transcription factor [Candidatus Omnitrophota bacterium]MBU4590096.1 metalloregulator ArsR/SmtB family transcription factor [Candidatus Omnitrophota bacterium]